MYILLLLLLNVQWIRSLELDYDACGIDGEVKIQNGTQTARTFPWLGILYHTFLSDTGMDRATTMVIFIHRQFVLGSSSDISSIPLHKIKTNTKVLLGADWESDGEDNPGYSVVSYVVHPEHNVITLNTLAIVKLERAIENVEHLWPVCPPATPDHINKQLFNIVIDDVKEVKKVLREMKIVKEHSCNAFYQQANLSFPLMWPTRSLCAVSTTERGVCLWEGGSALVSRDSWGRWHLVGLGVRGPGCGIPSRYIDIFSYLRWIESAFDEDGYLTLTRKSSNTLYLRQGRKKDVYKYRETNRFGDCDPMDKSKFFTLYEEYSSFQCDQLQPVRGHYRFALTRTVNFTCIRISTFSAVNAVKPTIWVETVCPRDRTCHQYVNSTATLKISFVFTFKMTLMVKYLGNPVLNYAERVLPDATKIKAVVIKSWQDNAM